MQWTAKTQRRAFLRSLALAGGALALSPRLALPQAADVPYIATPPNVVDAMLKLADVGPGDFVVDLGSGDGRIVIAAAKRYGARGLGIEIDGALVSEARREAAREGVSHRVEFRAENLFVTDLQDATVITMYLYPSLHAALRPRILEQVRPGGRIVSHEFDFGAWKPDASVVVSVPNKPYGPPRSEVFLWIVPANAAGRWQWRVQGSGVPVECDVALDQTFQTLAGQGTVNGKPALVDNGRMRGDEIRFELVVRAGSEIQRHVLAGRIGGDTIRGTVRAPGGGGEWLATRTTRGKINLDAAARAPALGAIRREGY